MLSSLLSFLICLFFHAYLPLFLPTYPLCSLLLIYLPCVHHSFRFCILPSFLIAGFFVFLSSLVLLDRSVLLSFALYLLLKLIHSFFLSFFCLTFVCPFTVFLPSFYPYFFPSTLPVLNPPFFHSFHLFLVSLFCFFLSMCLPSIASLCHCIFLSIWMSSVPSALFWFLPVSLPYFESAYSRCICHKSTVNIWSFIF